MNKLLVIIALVSTVTLPLLAQSPEAPETPEEQSPVRPEPVKDVFPRWTVVGQWRVAHPDWTDVLTLRADGTLVTSRQHTTGRWLLTGDGGTPMIVMIWDHFGTESVTMVTPDHFRGQRRNRQFIDMQRCAPNEKAAPNSH